MTDFTLYRARVRLTTGLYRGTIYANAVGRIVNIIANDSRPYGLRLSGFAAWDIQWLAREDFQLLDT